jgi:hypothetical protein
MNRCARRSASALASTIVVLAGLGYASMGQAVERFSPSTVRVMPDAGWHAVSEQGPRWLALSAAQREALRPLEEDWAGIDGARKQKWLEIAARFPSMSTVERSRLQERMSEWARLTPSQRGETRANFQQAARVVPQDRQQQWEAYKALPDAERTRLATQAAAARPSAGPVTAAAATGAAAKASARAQTPSSTAAQTAAQTSAKSNIVPNPTFATTLRPVGPSVVRSGPGATTTLVSRKPSPPIHQTPGLPKVAATPVLVDQATLLPTRGPQAAPQFVPSTPTISGDGAPAE